jgi:hypothetical protein
MARLSEKINLHLGRLDRTPVLVYITAALRGISFDAAAARANAAATKR